MNNQGYPNSSHFLRWNSDEPSNKDGSTIGQKKIGWFQSICCDAKDRLEVDIKCEIWTIFTSILIIMSTIAVFITVDQCEDDVVSVWNHTKEECNDPEGFCPMLLSRALTTLDWARAFSIGFAIIAAGFILITPLSEGGITHKPFIKIPLIVALFIFSDAFVVNMFENNVHAYLIGVGAGIAILFTIPGCKNVTCFKHCYRADKPFGPCGLRNTWWILWITMVISGTIFIGFWLIEENAGKLPLKSWWYVSEYIFFWVMFFLVGIAIGAEESSDN